LYLSLCFYLSPAFEGEDETAAKSTPIILFFLAVCYLEGIINVYFAVLLSLKILFIHFRRNADNKRNELYYEAALLIASWIALSFINCFYLSVPIFFKSYVLFVVPAGITVYIYAVYNLCPNASSKKRPNLYYWLCMFLIVGASTIFVYFICLSHKTRVINLYDLRSSLIFAIGSDDNIQDLTVLNLLTQLFIVTPLARYVYNDRNAKKEEEITTLKTELGKSDANLNFLKSQINPHFLFNALNTLYATALQENADRTGEGIQKLGDMMRFMLDENMQDKILLERDIEYLKNYIALQKLRIQNSAEIMIDSYLEDYTGNLLIAPMLVIPFVENAFKHGISLQNPSHIKVTLRTDQNVLYFDVNNSIHIRTENDPEKSRSGIGLENVKQRLGLLYPEKHDLVIHQNSREFFVHLTLQLIN
ncbi:MAG: histidine kinase, partial [Sphingobacteriaceae bacterium]